jgi:hypothetical protein
MTLGCTLKTGLKKEVRIALTPPLAGYDDVKPRLLEMKAISQEKLGMVSQKSPSFCVIINLGIRQIKAPKITSFNLPRDCLGSGLLVSTITYMALSPSASTWSVFSLAHIAHDVIGRTPLNYAFYVLCVAHVLESVYTFTLCRKHKTGFFLGVCPFARANHWC